MDRWLPEVKRFVGTVLGCVVPAWAGLLHMSTLPLAEDEEMPLAPPPLKKGRSARSCAPGGDRRSRFAFDPHPPRPAQGRARRPPLCKGRWSKRPTSCHTSWAEVVRAHTKFVAVPAWAATYEHRGGHFAPPVVIRSRLRAGTTAALHSGNSSPIPR